QTNTTHPALVCTLSNTTDVCRSPTDEGTRNELTWHSTASIVTASAASSGVGGTAEAGEDLSPLGEVPVAEGVADGDRPRRPRAAAPHLVAAGEVPPRVPAVRGGPQARGGRQVGGPPRPPLAQHL